MSTTLSLRPFDKLFVKDGRPLSLEDDSAASGLFPPPPSVIFGALRSAALVAASAPPGSPADPLHGGRLTGIAFAKEQDGRRYFPAPSDLVREKQKETEKRKRLPGHRLLLESDTVSEMTSYPISNGRLLSWKDQMQVESVGGYVSSAGLTSYLRGEAVAAEEITDADQLYTAEPKLGIGLDYRSGTTKDGLLYTMAMQRPCSGVTLCVRSEGFGKLTPMVRLGAESRAVEIVPVADAGWPAPVEPAGKRFTIYLATPAVFQQGWLPDFLRPDTMEGELGGATVGLVAASLGRYLPLGGWDIAARKPKPMRRAVNAGAVYHLEVLSGQLSADRLHGAPLPTHYPHSGRADASHTLTYQQQGFGIAYLGQGPDELPTSR